MALIPAGPYTPFQRVRPIKASAPIETGEMAIGAFRLDVEPVTNAEFLDFVARRPEWRKSRVKPLVRRRPLSEALALRSLASRRSGARRASHQRVLVRRRGLLSRARASPADDRPMGIRARRQWARQGRSAIAFARMVRRAEPEPPARDRRGPRQRFRPARHGRSRLGVDARFQRLRHERGIARSQRQGQRAFCGGAAAGVSDPTDYPAFMRYAMRASLKADYTADNVGFRCAGDAS